MLAYRRNRRHTAQVIGLGAALRYAWPTQRSRSIAPDSRHWCLSGELPLSGCRIAAVRARRSGWHESRVGHQFPYGCSILGTGSSIMASAGDGALPDRYDCSAKPTDRRRLLWRHDAAHSTGACCLDHWRIRTWHRPHNNEETH